MDTIVVPLDEFPLSEAALPVAASLAGRSRAIVHLVTVISPGVDPLASEVYLSEQAKRVTTPTTTGILYSNDVAGALLTYLDEHSGSLVCMGAHGRTGAFRVLGSVSEALIRRYGGQVLVVGPRASSPPPPDRILVCLDRSALAEAALPPARELAVELGADLELLHVDTERDGGALADVAYLERLATSITSVPVYTGHVQGTSAGRSIVRYAARYQIGLIAAATHGRSGLPGLFLGSVAQQLVHRAPCPVLLTHPATEE